MGPSPEELHRPVGPETFLGTIPEVEGKAGETFTERSWVSVDFVYDWFRCTPLTVVTTPSSTTLQLRETAISNPPGIQTFATLFLLPMTIMGLSALSPEHGGSSFRPP